MFQSFKADDEVEFIFIVWPRIFFDVNSINIKRKSGTDFDMFNRTYNIQAVYARRPQLYSEYGYSGCIPAHLPVPQYARSVPRGPLAA